MSCMLYLGIDVVPILLLTLHTASLCLELRSYRPDSISLQADITQEEYIVSTGSLESEDETQAMGSAVWFVSCL